MRVIPTAAVNPARKRDYALAHAHGEIFAFLDDDAYPDASWLKNAARHFDDPDVAAVGGPAVTPPDDSLMQKAGGSVYESVLVSGGAACRYAPGKKRFTQDCPSCNFIVRASVMRSLGGFNTDFWPGEDTKFCLDIAEKLRKKIVYDPDVLVYHHRRRLFAAHLRQIASYALHRGYFARRYPQTSFRPAYFIPSLFVIALAAGAVISVCPGHLRSVYAASLTLYLLCVAAASLAAGFRNLLLILPVFSGIILTHIVYGLYFLKGLTASRLTDDTETARSK